jgi:endonuclease/exonuclease/phosphatase family metal-dependent hydrolase
MKRFSLPLMTAEAAAANEQLRNRSSSELRVATWNVWFDQTCKDERIASLLREVLCAAPDVVCLQEVLPELEKALRECSELNEVYNISPFGIRHYGNLILVRRDLEVSFAELELISMMDRSLLLAHIRRQQGLRSEDFTVATVHLESLNSEKVRRAQLQEAAAALKLKHHRSVLCGDFNFDATQTWGDWRLPEPARTAPERLEIMC